MSSYPSLLPDLTAEEALTREVYARFGLAYYMTECVHAGLVQVVAVLGLDVPGATLPRIEERTKVAQRMTFGELVPEAKQILPTAVHASLDWALIKRNFLAHGFWYERIHMMSTSEGKSDLVDELSELADRLRELDRAIDDLVLEHHRKLGMTDEMFEAAMANAKAEPVEPMPQRRVPKVDERLEIVRAWVARAPDGGPNLVLEDSDGERWQLCDAGLGWCYLVDADGTWKPFSKLRLPAKIVARPRAAKHWNYKLHVSSGALIAVSNPAPGRFEWKIEKLPGP